MALLGRGAWGELGAEVGSGQEATGWRPAGSTGDPRRDRARGGQAQRTARSAGQQKALPEKKGVSSLHELVPGAR